MFNKGRTVYHGTAVLFRISKTLSDGPLGPGRHEWSFEFTFPEVTEGEKKKWLDIPPYNVKDGQPLPPSMVFDSKQFDRDSGKGAVVYLLEAKFAKAEKTSIFGSDKTAYYPLYFVPYRKYETPAAKIGVVGKETFTCNSKLLGAQGEKPKSFLKRFKTPTSVFEVSVTAPQIVWVGGPLPITLLLKHDLEKSTAPDVPTVTLTSCTISLIRTMHATGKAIMEDDGQYSISELLGKKEKLEIPLGESHDLSALCALSDFQSKYGMSFATYNLAQTFRLLVKLELTCADKRFWTELRSNLVILSPFTKELLEKNGGDPASFLVGMNSTGDDEDVSGELLLSILGIGVSALGFV